MKIIKIIYFTLLLYIPCYANGQNISTIVGTGDPGYSGDSSYATLSKIGMPLGITVYNNELYIGTCCVGNFVRKIDISTGVIYTVAGSDTASSLGGNGNGGLATNALLYSPYDVAIDNDNNLYIADFGHSQIRRVDKATGVIVRYAGTTDGSSGDGGLATTAKIGVGSIEIDKSNIYLYNFGVWERKVRRINMNTGIIETFAGTGVSGYEGDGGPASAAKFGRILGGAIDKYGNIYIGDWDNHRIRKVNIEDGTITTVVGNGIDGFSGDGGLAISAALKKPASICFDTCGNMYFSDEDNNRVRKVDAETGIITTIAGNGIPGFSGDGGLAINAQFNHPTGVCIDNEFNLYVGDYYNHRVRKIALTSSCIDSSLTIDNVNSSRYNFYSIYPNPTHGEVTVEGRALSKVAVCNVVGQVVSEQAYKKTDKVTVDISNLPPGVYVVRVNDVWVGKVVKE